MLKHSHHDGQLESLVQLRVHYVLTCWLPLLQRAQHEGQGSCRGSRSSAGC